MESIEIPDGWLCVPLPTMNNKNFNIYIDQNKQIASFSVPFQLQQLPFMYRVFYEEPLCYDINEIEARVQKAAGIKIQTEKERKKLRAEKDKNKIQVEKDRKKHRMPQINSDSTVKRVKTIEDCESKEEYCQNLRLVQLKVNTNDPISLIVQTCESQLYCRPEVEFTSCGTQHRCIVKIKGINREVYAVEGNKKKAKNSAFINVMKEVSIDLKFFVLAFDPFLIFSKISKNMATDK